MKLGSAHAVTLSEIADARRAAAQLRDHRTECRPPDDKPIGFEREVRVTFDRIRQSMRKLDADMETVVNLEVYLTDLAHWPEFSKARGEVFPHDPPTSTAVQVAGLLFGACIEIDAVAFVAKS